MKSILFFSFLSTLSFSHAQDGRGALKVDTFKSTTGKRKDNTRINAKAHIVSEALDTMVLFTTSSSAEERVQLPPGTYEVTVVGEDEGPRVFSGVVISADRITFLDVIYEPEKRVRVTRSRMTNSLVSRITRNSVIRNS